MLKAMLVDDEKWALSELAEVLRERVEIVGAFDDPITAIEKLPVLEPDVVFLDVVMPEMDGFQAATQIIACRPEVSLIFVTAYSRYAIKAFEVEAVDYVLKPFEPTRVLQALQRVECRVMQKGQEGSNVVAEKLQLAISEQIQKKVGLWEKGTLNLVNIASIDACFIKKNARHVTVLAGGKEYQDHSILNEFVAKFSEINLLRCHRSYYINPASIQRVCMDSPRTMILELVNYTVKVPVSRQYRQGILVVVGQNLINK